MVGTSDGLAMYPYIRESRRIKAEFTVLERHVAEAVRGEHGAEKFYDSVGIGAYRIDLHPSTGVNYIDVGSWPFQIPLGALIPVRVENLIPACKNIGTTHITNGCYRLHLMSGTLGSQGILLRTAWITRYPLAEFGQTKSTWQRSRKFAGQNGNPPGLAGTQASIKEVRAASNRRLFKFV